MVKLRSSFFAISYRATCFEEASKKPLPTVQYDDTISLDIVKMLASDCTCMFSDAQTLVGIFYPSYSALTASTAALVMHIEKLEDQELCRDIMNWAIKELPCQEGAKRKYRCRTRVACRCGRVASLGQESVIGFSCCNAL
jgi:hypothetical protein